MRIARSLRWFLAAGVGFALLETVQIYLGSSMQGRPVSWRTALGTLPSWAVLGLLVPFVVWLARRLPITGDELIRRVVVHLMSGSVFAIAHLAGTAALHALTSGQAAGLFSDFPQLLRLFFVLDILTYGAIAGAVWTFDYQREVRRQRQEELELRAQLAEVRLEALRRHLDPHFLFNTLNGITTLAYRSGGDHVAQALELLGELLHESLLRDEGQLIPLDRELTLLDKFLALQRQRFPDRLRVTCDVDADARVRTVPALVLQPLIENAIEHGLERTTEPIHIEVRSYQTDGDLLLEVIDDGPGLDLSHGADGKPPETEGIGLSNTTARLELLYGPGEWLKLEGRQPRGTIVRLRVPTTPVTAPATSRSSGAGVKT